eukprot:129884-Rhodomonas_salina.1
MFENFFHSSRAVGVIGMESGVGVPDFERAGEEYCRRKWDEVSEHRIDGLRALGASAVMMLEEEEEDCCGFQ